MKFAVITLAISLLLFGLLMTASLMELRQQEGKQVMDERCLTGARYEAMREAYAAGRPDPCNGAKEWVR